MLIYLTQQCLHQIKDFSEDQRAYWLENTNPEGKIKWKEGIREVLNGLQHLKSTTSERRPHLGPLENVINMFHEDLSRQTKSSDTHVAVYSSFGLTWDTIGDMLVALI